MAGGSGKGTRPAGCVDTVSFEKRFEKGLSRRGSVAQDERVINVEVIGREQQRRSVAYSRSRGQL